MSLAFLLAGLTGCPLTPTFTTGYTVERAQLRPQPIDAALAVRRFEEQRPPRLYTTQGRGFLTYVPLLPYVSLPFERLDESVQMLSEQIRTDGIGVTYGAAQNLAPPFETYSYPVSIAQALATDLAAQNLFREVAYVGDGSPATYRYVLSGAVRATPLTQSVTSYGLGIVGVYLWLLPIPMSKTTGSVTVDLTLTDTQTNEVVWRYPLKSELSRITMLYTGQGILYGGSAFSYSMILPPSDAAVDRQSLFAWHFEALRLAMIDAKPQLVAALRSR